MDIYHHSMLTRRVSIPMIQMGGSIQQVIMDSLSKMEGKCGEEGYIKRGSIQIFNYSCGMIKGPNVIVQVVFECDVSNPVPNQEFDCIVEHNTRAGIKARLAARGDSPFIVFLARDHHYMIPQFSEIKENEHIRVKVLGQRFEINDPKISVIATLIPGEVEHTKNPVSDTPPEYSPPYRGGDSHPEAKVDTLVITKTATNAKPGKGTDEYVSKAENYIALSKIVHWRQQLSPFDVAEFKCDGSPEHGIVFKDAKWKTLEHFNQACKIYLQDPSIALTFCVGGKHGESPHNLESKCKLTPENLNQWESIKLDVMYIGAKAKFDQHESKMNILMATSPAELMYANGGELIHYTHYEKIRDL
jgi:predicted NAD-dependent protein-ADP-ribosyltransferase YbiA (DUF1768 family)